LALVFSKCLIFYFLWSDYSAKWNEVITAQNKLLQLAVLSLYVEREVYWQSNRWLKVGKYNASSGWHRKRSDKEERERGARGRLALDLHPFRHVYSSARLYRMKRRRRRGRRRRRRRWWSWKRGRLALDFHHLVYQFSLSQTHTQTHTQTYTLNCCVSRLPVGTCSQ
jgi:hypothetical protein